MEKHISKIPPTAPTVPMVTARQIATAVIFSVIIAIFQEQSTAVTVIHKPGYRITATVPVRITVTMAILLTPATVPVIAPRSFVPSYTISA
jgi:hypothetical protein